MRELVRCADDEFCHTWIPRVELLGIVDRKIEFGLRSAGRERSAPVKCAAQPGARYIATHSLGLAEFRVSTAGQGARVGFHS